MSGTSDHSESWGERRTSAVNRSAASTLLTCPTSGMTTSVVAGHDECRARAGCTLVLVSVQQKVGMSMRGTLRARSEQLGADVGCRNGSVTDTATGRTVGARGGAVT